MPSPFPGMDPYLEAPLYWTDFHHEMISAIRALIRGRLPKGFVARVEERLYILDTGIVRPDVVVLRREPETAGSTRTALLERPLVLDDESDVPLYVSAYTETIREPFIEIVAVHEPGRVITTVEVLSPANKRLGSNGLMEYRRKQEAVLNSPTSLLEVDLLRGGAHTVAVPLDDLRREGSNWQCVACMHRGGASRDYEVWPISLRQPLPRVRVPLTPDIADLTIDLQTAFERAFEAGGYADTLDYRVAPDPPLNVDDTAWADALLHDRGFR
jgi:hypothetical protein